MRGDRTARSAFTLIEMVVATVLSAILLVVLLGVSRQTLMLRDSAMRIADQLAGTELLEDQFQRDFAQADRLMVLPDGVLLQGAIYRGNGGLNANHQSATVRYRVKSLPSSKEPTTPWLFREQWQVDPNTNQIVGAISQPIWRGSTAMKISSNTIAALSTRSDDEGLLGDDSQVPFDAMPENVQVQLLDSQGSVFLRQTIHHHWEE
ncbi:MAG: prepilin-type N-terminal cleavage/methylation domain-containing protein [Pirellulaceae bacterium]